MIVSGRYLALPALRVFIQTPNRRTWWKLTGNADLDETMVAELEERLCEVLRPGTVAHWSDPRERWTSAS